MKYHALLAFEMMAYTHDEMNLFMDSLVSQGWTKQAAITCTWEKVFESPDLNQARADLQKEVENADEHSGKPLLKYTLQVGEMPAIKNF